MARYDLVATAQSLSPSQLATREPTQWRHRELLPVGDARYALTLGKGWSPLVHARSLGSEIGFQSEKELMQAVRLLCRTEGMFTCSEGAAPWPLSITSAGRAGETTRKSWCCSIPAAGSSIPTFGKPGLSIGDSVSAGIA